MNSKTALKKKIKNKSKNLKEDTPGYWKAERKIG
jgi:hypothetical protein